MDQIKQKFVVLCSVMLAVLFGFGCNDDVTESGNPAEAGIENATSVNDLLGEEMLAEVNNAINLYSGILDNTVAHYSGAQPGSVTHDELEAYGNSLLQTNGKMKRTSAEAQPAPVSEKTMSYILQLETKLQEYTDSDEAVMETAEDAVNEFTAVANEFYQTVFLDATLTSLEKKEIISIAMFTIGALNANIANLEEISVLENGYTMSPSGWFSKLKKKIKENAKCILSLAGFAAGAAITSVSTPIGGTIMVTGFGFAATHC